MTEALQDVDTWTHIWTLAAAVGVILTIYRRLLTPTHHPGTTSRAHTTTHQAETVRRRAQLAARRADRLHDMARWDSDYAASILDADGTTARDRRQARTLLREADQERATQAARRGTMDRAAHTLRARS